MPIVDKTIIIPRVQFGYRGDTRVFYREVVPVTMVRNRDGVSNPHYQSDIRMGRNATTTMSGNFDKLVLSIRGSAWVDHLSLIDPNDTRIYRSTTHGPVAFRGSFVTGVPVVDVSKADNRARIAFLKKARRAAVSFDTPTFLGELGQALRMIASPAQGIQRLLKNYLRNCKKTRQINGRPYPRGSKGYLEWKRGLGGLWLETVFGLVPLLSDVSDAGNLFRTQRTRKAEVIISGIGIEDTLISQSSSSQYVDGGIGGFPWIINEVRLNRAFVKYHGLLKRDVTGPGGNGMTAWGFTPSQFFPTAWELLPWSFLFDYFSNIGDCITAGVVAQESIQWVNRTEVQSLVIKRLALFDRKLASGSWGVGKFIDAGAIPSFSQHERRRVLRHAQSGIDYPTLNFEIPSLPAQWANMTALFAQAQIDVHPQSPPKKWKLPKGK